ncbi:MAG: SH3 domain-containing protein [Coxiellaceae bacterium]|nr:MAG: SH3 domain-containing protein [Coxiellaceae bacterium]
MRNLLSALMILSLWLFIATAQAAAGEIWTVPKGQDLKLYNEPNPQAKVSATLTAGQQVVPFFEQNAWIKVGDPKTGNVGWISKAQLKALTPSSLTIVRVLNNQDKNPSSSAVRIIQYGGNNYQVDPKQMQQLLQQIQQQQQQFESSFNSLMTQHWKMVNGSMEQFLGSL